MLKYIFQSYLKIPVVALIKNEKEGFYGYAGVTQLNRIYEIAYSNQRTQFYTKDELELRNFDQNQNIFSIEGSEGYNPDEPVNIGFQREESTSRLKKIATYLKEDSNFFPNNIILSANNERLYNGIRHTLLIDLADNSADSIDFKNYIGEKNLFQDDTGNFSEINFSDTPIELCRVTGNDILLPIFELSLNNESESEMDKLFQEGGEFYGLKGSEKIIKRRELQFYKVLWIIDGQHRVFSARYLQQEYDPTVEAKRARETSISFTCLLNAPIEKQAEIFITVNNKAKKVDTSLIYDLLPITPNEQSAELASKVIFDALKDTEESPFKGILYGITSNKNEIGTLSQSNFINEVKIYFRPKGLFSKLIEYKNLTPIYKLISMYFTQVNHIYSEAFTGKQYNDDMYGIYRTTGFGALFQVFIALVIDYELKDENFIPYESPDEKINHYFSEKITCIKSTFDFKRSSVSNFRGRAGQTELANLFKYLLRLTDDLTQSDIDKVENYLGRGKSRNLENDEGFNLNSRFKNAIDRAYGKGDKIEFKDALFMVVEVDEVIHFNKIIGLIIDILDSGNFYIKSKGKTPYNTLSSIITRDYNDSFQKLGNYTFKRLS